MHGPTDSELVALLGTSASAIMWKTDAILGRAGLRGDSEAWETLVAIAIAVGFLAFFAILSWTWFAMGWGVMIGVIVYGFVVMALIRRSMNIWLGLLRPPLGFLAGACAAWLWWRVLSGT